MQDDTTVSARKSSFNSQFGNPTGLLGVVVGNLMAMEHRQLHRKAIEMLALTGDESVLEIGFGPGTAIRLAADHASFVAGIDVSKAMVEQAKRRNRRNVSSNRVELLNASVAEIPYASDRFDVVYEVNTFHHWKDPVVGLAEIHRVLRVGGRFLLTLRKGNSSTYQAEVSRTLDLLSRQGFGGAALEDHQFGHGGTFILAYRL